MSDHDDRLRAIHGELESPEPFTGSGRRLLPFAWVTVAGILGMFVPGGRVIGNDLVGCLGLLALTAVLVAPPWPGPPRWILPAGAMTYIGFVLVLVQAQGGSSQSGSFSLSLLAVLWIALYGRRWQAVVVVIAATVGLFVSSELGHLAVAVAGRRTVLWFLITGGIAISVRQLRARFALALDGRNQLVAEAELMIGAVQDLTALRQPDEVVAAATRVAGDLMATPEGNRSVYLKIEGTTVSVLAHHDRANFVLDGTWTVDDQPLLRRAVETLQPVAGPMRYDELGENLRHSLEGSDLLYGMWVPVVPNGVLHGILSVSSRTGPISGRQRRQLITMGRVTELALANALTHKDLEELALIDPLTGCVNRRGMVSLTSPDNRSGRYCVLAADLDGFKAINDIHGHESGDRALVELGELLRQEVRPGDAVARLGGDEFVVILQGADRTAGVQVADRILRRLATPTDDDFPLRVSLGIACGTEDDDFDDVAHQADQAMYRAKRAGGMQWSEAPAGDLHRVS